MLVLLKNSLTDNHKQYHAKVCQPQIAKFGFHIADTSFHSDIDLIFDKSIYFSRAKYSSFRVFVLLYSQQLLLGLCSFCLTISHIGISKPGLITRVLFFNMMALEISQKV